MSERDTGFATTPFNVIAAFVQDHDSSVAVDSLAASGVPRSAITVHRPDDGPTGEEVAELEAEMQDELVSSWGALSGLRASRAFGGVMMLGLAGVVLGAAGGFGWASLFASGLSRLGRVLIVAGVAGLGGATIGFVAGGSGLNWRRRQERDAGDERLVGERDVLVAVHLTDRVGAERAAALLRELGAERVHLIALDGVPLPPQAQHPRPADPEGYWWRNAGHG